MVWVRHLLGLLLIFMAVACSTAGGRSVSAMPPSEDSVAIDQTGSEAFGGAKRSYLYVLNSLGGRKGTLTIYATATQKLTQKLDLANPVAIALDKSGNVYISNAATESVSVYEPSAPGKVRFQQSMPVTEVGSLAIAPSGDLYVINNYPNGSGSVRVYPPGQRKPSLTITDGVSDPVSLAFDRSGNLFVLNELGGKTGSVTVYPPHSNALIRTITRGIYLPTALAVDSASELFVANAGAERSTVTEYGAGETSLLRTIRVGIGLPTALAFDPLGNLYVVNFLRANARTSTITSYAPGSVRPTLTIPGAGCVTGICKPLSIAFDAGGRLYVPDPNIDRAGNETPGRVSIFQPGQTTIWRTTTHGINGPFGVAVAK